MESRTWMGGVLRARRFLTAAKRPRRRRGGVSPPQQAPETRALLRVTDRFQLRMVAAYGTSPSPSVEEKIQI
jgi:hypothetical protein